MSIIDGLLFDGSANINHYAICNTQKDVRVKVINVTGYGILLTGSRIIVNFKYGNTASEPALKIGNYGEEHLIHYSGEYIEEFTSDTLLELVYDGTYWNVVGEMNDARIDRMYEKFNSLVRPTLLYASTLTASALNTWVYASIPSLKDWKEVRMWLEVGDADCRYNTLTREHIQICVSGYANANYNGLVRASCDFTNTRIGLMVRSITGWGFSNIRITRVEGVVKV